MLAILGSFFHSAFFTDYFREVFLGVLAIIYFGVLVVTRPNRGVRQPTSRAPQAGTDLRS